MLNAMCSGPACRKPAVTIRHQSPAATAGPKSAPVLVDRAATLPLSVPPTAALATKTRR